MTAMQPHSSRVGGAPSSSGGNLADILERVLDRGVVIAGDIVVNVLDIELLTLKVRLLVASADTAREMGIDWWTRDPFLNSRAQAEQVEADDRDSRALADENAELRHRVDALERALTEQGALPAPEDAEPAEGAGERA
jgi:K+-transporting ATPase c subunit